MEYIFVGEDWIDILHAQRQSLNFRDDKLYKRLNVGDFSH